MTLSYGLTASMDCAHHLVGAGICEQPHGHTYQVEAQWKGLGTQGERKQAQSALQTALARFDHQDLNAYFDFPSAENLALELSRMLESKAPGLQWVRVWEGFGSWAEASPLDTREKHL